jgi:hypothetical protein
MRNSPTVTRLENTVYGTAGAWPMVALNTRGQLREIGSPKAFVIVRAQALVMQNLASYTLPPCMGKLEVIKLSGTYWT